MVHLYSLSFLINQCDSFVLAIPRFHLLLFVIGFGFLAHELVVFLLQVSQVLRDLSPLFPGVQDGLLAITLYLLASDLPH